MHLPHRFGRYILTEKIAQGGMAEIFKAKYSGEGGFSKEVAIKRLLPVWSENPEFVKMLIDEAKALVHLSHSNIVQVFELGRDGKIFYISMEWIGGIDLRRLFVKATQENVSVPLPFILFIVSEILKALDYAHHKKDEEGSPLHLIHRDVSPQNVLISFEGQVKLADFGIAKGNHRSLETTQAQVKGKYGYMSPEQARGEEVDLKTDLFATGVILYELLERKRLFDGVNDLAILHQVQGAELPSDALKSWPSPLRAIVLKSLQKDPRYRYAQASQFLADIQRLVLKEGDAVDSPLLGDFLRGIFSKNSGKVQPELVVGDETIAKPSAKKNFNFLKAASFSLIFFSTFFGWKRQPLESHLKPEKIPEVKMEIFKPILKGSVTIDAKPKALKGSVDLEGVKKDFVTPFYWGDLELEGEKRGSIALQLANGKEIKEDFALNPDHPHWVKTFEIEPPAPGLLRVQARPWGEVTIPGVIQKQETPINQLRLQTGEYRLRVYFPPKNQWAEKTIPIQSGTQKICQASFVESPPRISCY